MRYVLCCLLVLCSVANGAGPPGLVIAPDGYYVITDAPDGSQVMTKIPPHLIMYRGTPAPGPGPGPVPPDPQPPPVTSFSQQVSGWAKQVNDPPGAAALGTAYGTVGDSIAAGTIPPDAVKIEKVLAPTLDLALSMVGSSPAKWAKFRGDVATELTNRLIRNGGVMSKEQYVLFFSEVEAGLALANASYAIPPWLADILAQLIPIIIGLITRLLSGVGWAEALFTGGLV